MAKFTVLFNDALIDSYSFEDGVVRIGRDDTNEIKIDSLSIAPAHAVVKLNEDNKTIRSLNDSFPLFVNNEKTKEHPLSDGDKIGIGKHMIVFGTKDLDPISATKFNIDIGTVNDTEAYLQVTTGKHIGRVITLRKVMTKVGQPGDGVIIISKRKDGYYISALESHSSNKINDQPLAEQTLLLNANDRVEVEGLIMQFYVE